ncbi:MAG TPA: type II secretion system protein, partial [Thermoanaerobaculia bacterium]
MVIRVRRGFTLIELTIAVVLLAIGLLALTGALVGALRATSTARAEHAALRRAEAVADSLVSMGVPGAGSLTRPGFTIWWAPEPCALGECVRVHAAAASDTLSLLA